MTQVELPSAIFRWPRRLMGSVISPEPYAVGQFESTDGPTVEISRQFLSSRQTRSKVTRMAFIRTYQSKICISPHGLSLLCVDRGLLAQVQGAGEENGGAVGTEHLLHLHQRRYQ